MSESPKVPIKVCLDNHWARFQCAPEQVIALKEHFSYKDPKAQHTYAFKTGAWDGLKCLLNYSKVGLGLFLHLKPELDQAGYQFEIEDRREPLPLTKPGWHPKSRPWQKHAVIAMSNSTGGLVLAATGTGKTFAVADFVRRLDCPACFVVDELTLLEQSRRALEELTGEAVGVIGRGEFNIQRLNVATVQTLHRQRHNPKFKSWANNVVILIDEFHVALNKSNVDVVSALKPRAVFGLTATLQLVKTDVLYRALALCGPVLFRYSIEQGQNDGYLTRGLVCCVKVVQSSRGWQRDTEYQDLIVDSSYRNRCVTALVREGLRRGRRIVVLVERLRHLKTLSAMLREVPHKCLSGKFSKHKGERIDAAAAMDAGKLPLILATRVFGKGIDISTLDVTVDATAMSSIDNAQQRYGRGVRRAEGKSGLIHFDISDVGNIFASNASGRTEALRALNVPVTSCTWEGSATAIYDRALKSLELNQKTQSEKQ